MQTDLSLLIALCVKKGGKSGQHRVAYSQKWEVSALKPKTESVTENNYPGFFGSLGKGENVG